MQKYERIGTLPLDEVFYYIKKHLSDHGKQRVQINDFFVNVQSLRLRTFYHTGIECPCCPNKASFFAVERSIGQQGGYHLNLYGQSQDGQEILFTHDHKIARGLGGLDTIDNTTTMCCTCNWDKGLLEQILAKNKNNHEAMIARDKLNNYYRR